MIDPQKRTAKGRFVKGCIANPGGRPKAAFDLQALARSHAIEAFETILRISRMEEDEPDLALKAAAIILERGYGKPIQPIEGGGDTHYHITLDQIQQRKNDPEAKIQVVDSNGAGRSEAGFGKRIIPLSV